jgi:hypothetical protein
VEALQAVGQTAELEVWRTGAAKNSPIDARILRAITYGDLYDLGRLAASCYQPPMRISEPIGLEPDRPTAPVLRIQDTRIDPERIQVSGTIGMETTASTRHRERYEELKRRREELHGK